jgi:hypothetical protein
LCTGALGHVTPNWTCAMDPVMMEVNVQAAIVFLKRYGHDVRCKRVSVCQCELAAAIELWKMLNH